MTHSKKAQHALSSRALLADTRGGIIIIFALILIPLLVIVAMSIDSTRINTLKRHVQSAVDSAALAAAREYKNPSVAVTVLEDAATHSFEGNIATRHGDVTCDPLTVATNAVTERVTVTGQCTVPAFIGVGLTGIASHTVSATATAEGPVAQLDLALVLDVSDSMTDHGRIEALKTSAKTLVNTIITPQTGTRVRISMVPYAYGVNAGVYGNPALGRPDGDDSDGDGADTVCVAERIGVNAETDAAPGPGSYSEVLYNPFSPDIPCTSEDNRILPLTHSTTTLTNAIDTLDPDVRNWLVNGVASHGWTNGYIGVAWGWYTLSPNWSGVWPAASSPLPMNSVRNRKVILLMSDGVMNGHPMRDPTSGDAIEQTRTLCRKAKRAGIEIFTIGFEMDSISSTSSQNQAKRVMEKCATSLDHYFLADDATELQQAFDDIGALLFLGTAITE